MAGGRVWRSAAALAALAAWTASAEPALAAARPRLVPVRDVAVDYALRPESGPEMDVRVLIQAGGQRLRITSDTLPATLLVDRQTETASFLVPMLRAYSDLNIARYDLQGTVLRDADFTRAGRGNVAGLACTVWRARSQTGSAEACITDDGVILEGEANSDRRGKLGAVRARRVVFAPASPQDFAIPPGFQQSPVRLDQLGLAR